MMLCSKFKNFSRFEKLLWGFSLLAIVLSFILCNGQSWLNLTASLVGATALIFVSKGDVLGQILTVIFSILYALISFEYRYYGEMITYLGMTMPIAVLSVIAWLKNPYEEGKAEVKVNRLSVFQKTVMKICSFVVTLIFYFILKNFHTPNLIVSTISITTSFLASYLMLFRSPAYAIAYALNDIVLIILWFLATVKNFSYLSVEICFIIFLINDIYGFCNWKKIEKKQLSK